MKIKLLQDAGFKLADPMPLGPGDEGLEPEYCIECGGSDEKRHHWWSRDHDFIVCDECANAAGSAMSDLDEKITKHGGQP